MYIKITDEIVQQAKEGKDNPSYGILQMLEWCRYLGNHLIHGDIDVLMELHETFLNEFPNLSRLWTIDAEQGPIIDTLEWHLEFVTNINKNPQTRKDDKSKTIYVNVKDGFDPYRECHLLAENLDDIKMYSAILNYFKRLNGYEKVEEAYYPILGGGNTTKDVYESEILLKKSLVLCIVDSDKHFSSDSVGETAKQVLEIENKYMAFNSYLYIMENVLEVENLVPIRVYEEYVRLHNTEEAKQALNSIKIIMKDNVDCLSFYDYKLGINTRRLLDNDPQTTSKHIAILINPEYEKVILEQEDCWKKYYEGLERIEVFSPNDRKKFFDKWEKSACCVKGFGKNILRNVLNSQYDKILGIEEIDLSPAQKQEYNIIGKLLYNWVCASKPIRI